MRIQLIVILFFSFFVAKAVDPYLDKDLPVDKRVNDLMSRMTLEEKIGQMCQYVAPKHIQQSKRRMKGEKLIENDQWGLYPGVSVDELKQWVVDGKVGSFLHVKDAQEANSLQELAMRSRLKIPIIIGIDAIHGHALIHGATVYPTQLALSSSWDDDLLYRVAKATAKEVRATGMHWTFSPNVDVARDARWGRCGETFGEDPLMVSRMGAAFTKGYQGDFSEENVLACAKHFIAGSEPVNGTNASPMDVSMRTLREIWLPPFEAQVNAGAYTFMAAHNELNGVPCHGNKMLLTDILRDEWGFKGFIVSDWMDIERLNQLHHVVPNQKEAVKLTVDAGMDMHMHGPDFLEPLAELVGEGAISEEVVDAACSKILRSKFLLGLFEKPFVEAEDSEQLLYTSEHQQLALEAARKSIVLLKNESILPLSGKERILITGPNANNHRVMGDWSLEQPEERIQTVYEGFEMVFGKDHVDFIQSGESLRNPDDELLKEAIDKANQYDAVVVVVGSNSLRYDKHEKNCGENIDRGTINLQGNQLKLVQSLYEKNKKVIVVLVNGRPLGEPWIKEHIPAIIEAWEPGAFGGQAIAEIVKGEVNPSGKITMTIPHSVGQIGITYNHKPSHYFHKYIDIPKEALWEFGHGLSYTNFEYSGLKISESTIGKGEKVKVSINVKNTGEMAGDEIVQLYLRDEVSSATRPVKELKDYQRISLEKGASKAVHFTIDYNDLAFYNVDMKKVVEPGIFSIMVGSSSNIMDLKVVQLNVIK